jgi:putative effector of murein hydrolase LrgA (UPF0299 family)
MIGIQRQSIVCIISFLGLPIGGTICSILILWISLASKNQKQAHNPAGVNAV